MANLASEKTLQLQGGYECTFVSEPPKILQTECSICLCVLRDPYLVNCCGNSFCKTCIEPIESESKLCPLCNVKFTTAIPDKRLHRTLNELQVYCYHREAGCDWVGELVRLSQHLNVYPNISDDRMLGCRLAKLPCEFCGDSIRRKDLLDHEKNKCLKRPFGCEYCNNCVSTFVEITTEHWPVCTSRPVPCPNQCGALLKQQSLDDHFDCECPLMVLECPFRYAGCSETFLRRDMADHMNKNLATHMSLQAAIHQEELKKLNARIDELEIQLHIARDENEVLIRRLEQSHSTQVSAVQKEMKKAHDKKFKSQLGTLKGELKKVQGEMKLEILAVRDQVSDVVVRNQVSTLDLKSNVAALHYHIRLVPVSFTMFGFQQKKISNASWYSPSFYTHPRGYRMCLRVNANGNGVCKGSHVSLYVHLMRGEDDESLKWPFRGEITVQLISNVEDHNNHTAIVHFTECRDDVFCRQVVSGERSSTGRGFHDFLCHSNLLPHYLKDDCLKLCIKEVNLN